MKSGTSGSTRHGRSLSYFLVISLFVSSAALAQEPAEQKQPHIGDNGMRHPEVYEDLPKILMR